MKIYNDYLQTIKAAVQADPKNRRMNENLSYETRNMFEKGMSFRTFSEQVPEKKLLPSLADLATTLGREPNFDQQLGLHPDFAHLRHSGGTENHYIVSMFVDISGSTNLFKRYVQETVAIITNTIQRAAIHTALIFDGYVHRLQGDGLFIYFGGKGISPKEAVERSLQFSSVFTYFVKNDLKNVFNEQGIEQIFTRIGVDLGHDSDVVWMMAGIGNISEVTTCSLHTSLASKMQGYAERNGVVAGDNIVATVSDLGQYFAPVCQRTDERDRYIFQIPEERFNYTQHDFDWLNYLKKQDFIATDILGAPQLRNRSAVYASKNLANLAPIAAVSKPSFNG